MSRLVFGPGAFIRKLQMSNCKIFAFVEGGLDRPFSERLLALSTSKNQMPFQIMAARELPGATGGKPRLIELYKDLKEKKLLKIGKSSVCAIFLDKDIDDLSKSVIRSPHVIYTSTYDLEGDLITCGDLLRAAADACGLTMEQARGILGEAGDWVEKQCKNWLDWTTLCVISQLKQVNPGCTFSRSSDVNSELIGPVDEALLLTYKDKLRIALKMNERAFNKLYQRYKALIEAEIANGAPLKFFKGKWLLTLLEKDIVRKNTTPDAHLQAIGQIIPALLVGQVGNHDECACCQKHSAIVEKLTKDLA